MERLVLVRVAESSDEVFKNELPPHLVSERFRVKSLSGPVPGLGSEDPAGPSPASRGPASKGSPGSASASEGLPGSVPASEGPLSTVSLRINGDQPSSLRQRQPRLLLSHRRSARTLCLYWPSADPVLELWVLASGRPLCLHGTTSWLPT
ncbi:hypothetical protein ATANTOWER_008737 [Ataeniobius toweri]|uniref:Uncharacterized protein n=1 Tax=Ataeniobius toweri TaxID=208326 RepID=A0ABU7BPF8_9TELE|nr:hypothetical protein [Ataeniobius toweri]